MSTAKRLVLSLRGRKDSSHNGSTVASGAGTTTSSSRLIPTSAGISGSSPGHELDEIAVVSGSGVIGCSSSGVGGSGIGVIDTGRHASYGSLLAASGQSNGPRFVSEFDDNWTPYQNMNINNSGTGITYTIDKNIYNPNHNIIINNNNNNNIKNNNNNNQLKRIVCKNNHQNGVVGVGGGVGVGVGVGVGGGGGIINGGYCFNDNIALHLIDYGGSIIDPLSSSTAGQMVGDNERYWCDSDVDMLLLRRQSVADIVSSKFGLSTRSHLGQSISQQGFFSTSRDSLSVPCISGATPTSTVETGRKVHSHVSVTASEMDLSRKGRGGNSGNECGTTSCGGKKDGRTVGGPGSTLGEARTKSGEQPLLGSWSRSGTSGFGGPGGGGTGPGGCGGGPRGSMVNTVPNATASSNHLNGCNGTERSGRRSGSSSRGGRRSSSGITISPSGAKWTFVFDPAGRLCYYWSMVVSLAFLYNFWVIIYRFAFQEINGESIVVWFCLDYFSDFLYLVDILFHFRTGYLEDGVLQTDSTKLRQHYMNSTTFYIDCLCLLPLDFLYLSIGFNSILRSFRLVKIYRFWAFMDRTERHTNYPNLFRSTSLIHYLLVIFHWNGCLYHIIYKNNGFGSKNWVFHDSESADVVKQYLQSYYWCTLALTTIGDLPRPRSKAEYVFVIAQLLFGLMLFATVLGHVANIVTSVSAARKEFQAKLDGVKTYMRMRRVPNHLQVKVIKWFDYLWLTQKCSDEERAVSCLPDKLKAEIAINVHLDTLKRVEIFQNTEAGFLCELVLRLRPVLFSPGDYICRKGEVGKEMYIVNRGRLQVVADNGKTVMASLKAGSYFGEISILNMGTAGNRRTASVRSVGYSDLFVLSKKDMWDVLKEYPAARVRLEAIAVKRLEKYKKAPLEKVAMGRCQSTPGLVETKGRTPLEEMWITGAGGVTGCGTVSIAGGQSIAYGQSISQVLSPRCNRIDTTSRVTESPGSMSPSANSSDVERPRSRTTSHHSRPQSQPTRRTSTGAPLCDSLTHLESSGATPLLGSHEVLEDEVKRLRERLHTVEAENIALNSKLAQQQYELEHRLAEIEMQICGASSASSIDQELHEQEEIERNRESII